MRLVCPNCSAQYEIDGSMIPDEGRDVQCSNCGHTWFELPPLGQDTEVSAEGYGPSEETSTPEDSLTSEFEYDSPDEAEEEEYESDARPENLSREVFEADDAVPDADSDDADLDPEAGTDEAAETSPSVSDDDDDASDAASDDATSDAVRDVAAAAAASNAEDDSADSDATSRALPMPGPRRPADAAALDILREEAERELSQRRAPPSESIETQTDLGLDDIQRRKTPSRALRARMAHLGEDAPEEETRETEKPVSERADSEDDDDYAEPRRDLLPDIDEINSTLKPSGRRETSAETGRTGFRAGFLLVLLVVIGLIFAYAQAPAIARALPETEGALISYVDTANAFRDWVDGLIGR